jgi:F-type H+-transporting ATPase subunit a
MTTATTTTTRKWKYGFKRWIVLALIIASGVAAFAGPRWYAPLAPIKPPIVMPAEEIGPGWNFIPPFAIGSFRFPGVPFTNTVLSTLLTDVLLLAIALFVVRPYVRGKNPIPPKLYAGLEMLIEYFWNLAQSSAGVKWARRFFPIVMTIFLLIVTANTIKMIPGYETIGWLKPVAAGSAEKSNSVVPLVGNLYALVPPAPASSSSGGTAATEPTYTLLPFLRGSSTDINFPLAMAVFVVGGIFVFGFWSQKGAFLGKYFPLGRMIAVPLFGTIDFIVGLLEFILEFVKIISLSLRLFFNIFAGGVLLLIMGSMLAVILPAGLSAFELFVGAIQAYVFAMLAVIFFQQAIAGHSEEGH